MTSFRTTLPIALGLALTACVDTADEIEPALEPTPAVPADAARDPAPAPRPDGVPADAVLIKGDLYAVPLDYVDGDGCRPWRLYSPTRMTAQALHYRKADGSFTMAKAEARCGG